MMMKLVLIDGCEIFTLVSSIERSIRRVVGRGGKDLERIFLSPLSTFMSFPLFGFELRNLGVDDLFSIIAYYIFRTLT